ncbi:MAG: hypothetical protein HGA85_03915 [Nanoarchaeota archaeon]|nr:hypothetical protein [Nanoarchaeota archaeon]
MKNTIAYSILVMMLAVTSCVPEQRSGGGCTYNRIDGKAEIISISDAPPEDYNCPDSPKKVVFRFTPNNPDSTKNYKFPEWSDTNSFTLYAGENPSADWVARNNIAVGNTYGAIRSEETEGTCTPVVFSLDGLDAAPEEYCK